jgi:hypothetical protein
MVMSTFPDIPRRKTRMSEGNELPVVYIPIGVFLDVKGRKAMTLTLLHQQGDDIRSGLF